jgi:hypothetical protein
MRPCRPARPSASSLLTRSTTLKKRPRAPAWMQARAIAIAIWACRFRSRQRHNAGCPAFEVRIHYPFHPRCGQMVPVTFRRRFAGEEHLVVIQPDGTLALVPSWMVEAAAGSATLTTCPRLSIGRLVELRMRLDTLLASCGGESALRGGTDHAPTTRPAERLVRGGPKAGGVSCRTETRACLPDRVPSERGGCRLRDKGASRRSRDEGGGA